MILRQIPFEIFGRLVTVTYLLSYATYQNHRIIITLQSRIIPASVLYARNTRTFNPSLSTPKKVR